MAGVFDDIGGVEVGLVAGEEIAIGGAEGGAVWGEEMAGDFTEVEIGGEKIVVPSGGPVGEASEFEAAGGGGSELGHHGHEGAGAWVAFEGAMFFAPDAPVDGVEDAVAFSVGGILEESATEEAFAGGGEDDIDGVIHACGDHGFEVGAIGAHAIEVGGAAGESAAIAEGVVLFGETAFAPIDEAIGASVGAVEIVGATGEGFAIEPDDALVGDAIAVGIGEFPDVGWSGDVEGAIEPERAFWEHDFVGEDGAFVEDTVAVGIGEADDAVGFIGELFFDLFVGA